MRDMVALIDLDGLCSRTMARKLRAEHFYCKLLPADVTLDALRAQEAMGIILCGGFSGEPLRLSETLQGIVKQCDVPVLAMGDAALAACELLGGSLGEREDEPRVIQAVPVDEAAPILTEIEALERYAIHPRCLHLAEDMAVLVAAEEQVLGFRVKERPLFAMAFQVERNDPDGVQLLINFCREECGCTPWWSNRAFADRAVEEIRRCVGEGEAVCALSGGVDSGVCAILGNMAIGQRLHCIFVDTGLLREGESERIMAFYGEQMGLNLLRVDAKETFLTALCGVRSAKEKEAIIFRLLRETLEKARAELSGATVVIQGTNYSDVLLGHGLSGAAEEAALLAGECVLEPVRELFKDEIRRVAEELGLPQLVIQRQPFPGSGLALRILSDVTEEKLNVLRRADAIFREEIEESGQSKRLWQYFATLAENPAEEDGSMVVTLRAVQVSDGAAAMEARLPYDLLETTVETIRRQVPCIRRVVYDLTPSGSYSGIEWR